ncbi:MAG: nucleoside-diphosphate kinase, partial [Cyanobacteriota bacterium]|nr:nucleoside-diphosphate kinase [Cyanobacteriota bacterium]
MPSGRVAVDDGSASLAFFMAAERSFVAIKPDGVQRGLVGEI